jgi:hypothetical protein
MLTNVFKCVRCIGDQGRLLVIGFASGTIPKFPINLALIKGFSLVGVRAGESMMRNPQLAIVRPIVYINILTNPLGDDAATDEMV